MSGLTAQNSVSLWSKWNDRMEKRVNRLGWFVIFLFVVAFGSVLATGIYLWDRIPILFWFLVISVPLAFLLKKKVNSMEKRWKEERQRRIEHLNSSDGKVEDTLSSLTFKAKSTEELLKLEKTYKDAPAVLALIDDILEERREAIKKSQAV